MAAGTYEISPSVENYSKGGWHWTNDIVQNEKRNFLSPSGHVMFYSLYRHQWNIKPFHLHVPCERRPSLSNYSHDDLFAHVTITSLFFTSENIAFARNLAWYNKGWRDLSSSECNFSTKLMFSKIIQYLKSIQCFHVTAMLLSQNN